MCRSDIHLISWPSASTSPRLHTHKHTHTHSETRLAKPPTFSPGGEQEVWERESDWLSGLTFVSQQPVN